MSVDHAWMQEHILDGTIEHDYQRAYLLRPGNIYCEIGAFWGRTAVIAHRFGCSKIILVEPSPKNAQRCRDTIAQYGISEAMVIQKAVSDHKGTRDFITWGNPAGNRLASSPQESETYAQDKVTVEVDTLEGILDSTGVDHIDLLGCDNENNEVLMVQGTGKWLSEHRIRNVAICAYHQEGNPEKIQEILKGHGYQDVKYEDSMVFGRV